MQTTQNNGIQNRGIQNSGNGTHPNGTHSLSPLLSGVHDAEGASASQSSSTSKSSSAPRISAPHDLLTCLRDKWGNRLGWSFAFSIPTVDDTPLEQTPLAGGLRVIEAQDSVGLHAAPFLQ